MYLRVVKTVPGDNRVHLRSKGSSDLKGPLSGGRGVIVAQGKETKMTRHVSLLRLSS